MRFYIVVKIIKVVSLVMMTGDSYSIDANPVFFRVQENVRPTVTLCKIAFTTNSP